MMALRARAAGRSHGGDLGMGPIQHVRADRMTFGTAAVEQTIGRAPVDGRGEFPTEIHRVTDSEVQSLAAQRRVNVRGVSSQENASAAVRRCLSSAIGPRRSRVQCGDGDVGAGNPA
jgi:hypothetical protein